MPALDNMSRLLEPGLDGVCMEAGPCPDGRWDCQSSATSRMAVHVTAGPCWRGPPCPDGSVSTRPPQ